MSQSRSRLVQAILLSAFAALTPAQAAAPPLSALIEAAPPALSLPPLPDPASPQAPPVAIAGRPGPAPASGKGRNGSARIASGPAYDACLALLSRDPEAAAQAAARWAAATLSGGDAALHCQALAEIALGRAAIGASMLEQLAATSHAPAAARARIEDQAAGTWMGLKQGQNAYGAATMAIALDPSVVGFHLDRALAAGMTGDYRGAIADLDRVLALAPGRADALVLRGVAWRHLGQPGRALADWRAAAAADPQGPAGQRARQYLAEYSHAKN